MNAQKSHTSIILFVIVGIASLLIVPMIRAAYGEFSWVALIVTLCVGGLMLGGLVLLRWMWESHQARTAGSRIDETERRRLGPFASVRFFAVYVSIQTILISTIAVLLSGKAWLLGFGIILSVSPFVIWFVAWHLARERLAELGLKW